MTTVLVKMAVTITKFVCWEAANATKDIDPTPQASVFNVSKVLWGFREFPGISENFVGI